MNTYKSWTSTILNTSVEQIQLWGHMQVVITNLIQTPVRDKHKFWTKTHIKLRAGTCISDPITLVTPMPAKTPTRAGTPNSPLPCPSNCHCLKTKGVPVSHFVFSHYDHEPKWLATSSVGQGSAGCQLVTGRMTVNTPGRNGADQSRTISYAHCNTLPPHPQWISTISCNRTSL